MSSLSDLRPATAPTTTPAGERIMEAASELFYLRGIHRTGVDLVAERAGVTKRTLYQRFGSKDSLIAVYLQQRAYLWQTYLLEGLDGNDADPLQSFYRLVREWAQRHTRGCAFVNAWVEVGDASLPVLTVIRAEKQWMREFFSALANGEEGTAETWFLLYEGAQVSAAVQASYEPFDHAWVASQHICGGPAGT